MRYHIYDYILKKILKNHLYFFQNSQKTRIFWPFFAVFCKFGPPRMFSQTFYGIGPITFDFSNIEKITEGGEGI